jgi:hypothetical protein
VGDALDTAMPSATVADIKIFRIFFSLVQIEGRGEPASDRQSSASIRNAAWLPRSSLVHDAASD